MKAALMKLPPKRAIVVAIAAVLATLLVTPATGSSRSCRRSASAARRPLSRLRRGRDQPDGAAGRRPAGRAAGRSRRQGQEGRPAVRHRSGAGQGRGGARRGGAGRGQARYENLLTGKRPEEQDVVRAQRRETEAAWRWPRSRSSARPSCWPRASARARTTTRRNRRCASCASRLASLAAQEKVGDLAARPDEIAAASGAGRPGPGQSRPGEEAARRPDAGRARGRR